MDRIPIQENPLSEQECMTLAKELYAQYDKILSERHYESERIRENTEIRRVLEQFPRETLHNYWGHGVTKGDPVDQLAAASVFLPIEL